MEKVGSLLFVRLLLLVVFLLVSVSSADARGKAVDSLLNVIRSHTSEDTTRVNMLNELAISIALSDSLTAMNYANEAEYLAGQLSYHKGRAYSNFVKGYIASSSIVNNTSLSFFKRAIEIAEGASLYYEANDYMGYYGMFLIKMGDFNTAIDIYNKGIKFCLVNDYKKGLVRSIGNLAIIYKEKGDFVKALESYEWVLSLSAETGDKEVEMIALNNIGAIFYHIGDYPKAQEYYFKALRLKEKNGNPKGLITGYLNIGTVIRKQGDKEEALVYLNKALELARKEGDKFDVIQCLQEFGMLEKDVDNKKALDYFKQTLSYSQDIAFKRGIITSLINIGDIYLAESNLESAGTYFEKALSQARESQHRQLLGLALRRIGFLNFKLNNYPLAIDYSLEGLHIAEDLKLIADKRDIYEQLHQIYREAGDYKNAYESLINFKMYSDSIFNEKKVRQVAEQEFVYRLEAQKQAIDSENQKRETLSKTESRMHRTVIYILGIGILVVLVLLFLIHRSNKAKQHINRMLASQKSVIEKKNKILKEFNEGKDKFFSILAHDLKSSFNSILGFSNILASDEEEFSKEETRMMATAIHAASTNTYKLLENLLSWSKSNVGMVGFHPTTFQLCELISANRPVWDAAADAKHIKVSCVANGDCNVFGDRDMINTILRNLITNAIKFTPDHGEVTINTMNNSKGIEIEVADTGIGISEEAIADLFIIGKINSRPGTHNEMGTGLGLLICKEFVQKHDGKIWVESEVGKGSRFKVFFPHEHQA